MNGITEIRPGTYIFGDLMQVSLGAHALEDCALTVKTTIVSRPSADRAVIDAGTKVFNGVDPSIPASILKTHGDWHTNDDESHPIA